ncbi:DUF2059 domain-containing protein [Prevotella sp. KH2C16]|uniref:DUF2059 domain-containing protein n=1 Tax=Prevotella sp. KH2C16 TaxID=1855325 RepID=UPI0008DFC7A6|nr:DUF2059 domain-containing protein [Prevotella sp. KH2C16]SFF87655.1 hypothetical protein SAMN05216383_101327 [Prevotella sp. KH2C16]
MKRIVIFLLLLSTLSCAQAQTAIPQQNSDKEYRETLDRLMQVSGTSTSLRAQFPLLMQMMRNMLADVPEEIMQKIEDKFGNLFLERIGDLYTPIYKRYLTLEDLKGFIAFYETPLGKKIAMTTPTMNKELMEAGQKVGQGIAEEVLQELKEEGYTPTTM